MRSLVVHVLLQSIAAVAHAQGFAPAAALRQLHAAEGFEVSLAAAEPLVRQPVAIEFDDRGRLWVIQYLQYPNPAGLKRVQVDRYSRTVYDRIPEPPPRGPRGEDRITILEDADGDGQFESGKDFIAGLNLASGIAFGRGGVFVAQAPYLLFYADRNRDDVPDGDPKALLQGFGMEDASSVINSLVWGPDGWLYGAQGSTVTADVRGIRFQQGVWRYHVERDRFELFHDGGGNTWGLDFDAFQCTPAKNRFVLEHGRRVIDPLLKALRGKVAVVAYSLPGTEDAVRKRLYRSVRGQPTADERRAGAVDLERALNAFSYAGSAIEPSFAVDRERPTLAYFRAFPGLDAGDKFDPKGFWSLPIPVMKTIEVHPEDVVYYDLEGYDVLKKHLLARGVHHVILAGYNTDMCVCSTTAGYKNLRQDFDVFLVGDATIATFPGNPSPRFATNAAVSFAALDLFITQVSWIQWEPKP